MGFFDIFKKKQDTPSVEQAARSQEELNAGLEKTKTGLFSKLARAVAGRSTIDSGGSSACSFFGSPLRTSR